MSDQRVITDWKAYFEALGPGTPSPHSRDVQPMFDGPVRCSVTFARKDDLGSRDMPEGRERGGHGGQAVGRVLKPRILQRESPRCHR